MSRVKQGLGAAAAAASGVVAKRVLQGSGSGSGGEGHDDPRRWRAVTVNLPPEQVPGDGGWPEPLATWGDALEIRTQQAPGDKGTEIHARIGDPSSVSPPEGLDGETPAQNLRSALRRAKQLLETGEVLRPDAPPTTERTLLSRPLEAVTRRGREGGLL
jgi:hypothetical protein